MYKMFTFTVNVHSYRKVPLRDVNGGLRTGRAVMGWVDIKLNGSVARCVYNISNNVRGLARPHFR